MYLQPDRVTAQTAQSDSTDGIDSTASGPPTSTGLRLLVAPGMRHVRLLELIISTGSLISLLSPKYYRLDLIMQIINLRNPLFPTQAFKRLARLARRATRPETTPRTRVWLNTTPIHLLHTYTACSARSSIYDIGSIGATRSMRSPIPNDRPTTTTTTTTAAGDGRHPPRLAPCNSVFG